MKKMCYSLIVAYFLLFERTSCYGYRDSYADDYEMRTYIETEGLDCLKDTTPLSNFTIDMTFTPEQEKKVLLDIYQTTNGHDWYNQSGWNSPNDTSHCFWYGISCHSNTSYVRSIALFYNNLNGVLPRNVWKIRNLLSLCIPGNPKVYGHMEDFIFANMSSMRIMIFNGASINGKFPEALTSLSLIQKFIADGLTGQGLSGNLPEKIGNMEELFALFVSDNSFTGQIPRSISKLKKLRFLELRNAPGKMWGYLNDLFSITSLKEMYVSGVRLIGNMPTSLPKNMIKLVLTGDDIHGNMPKIFPKGLKTLDVANNKLNGDIPGDLFLVPGINRIDVSQNVFSSVNNGQPWQSKQHFEFAMNYLSLADNRNLSIQFPSFINAVILPATRAFTFMMFNASFCDIKSPFPIQLFFMLSLVTIDIRGNHLYGKIPDVLTESSLLTYLDVSLNNLSDGLPSDIAALSSLLYLDISGNPSMKQSFGKSNNFLVPNFLKMTKPLLDDNFTCPEGKFTFNNGRVRLDPSFYQYRHCLCDSGFYGDSGFCKQCMPGGTCQKPVVMTINDHQPNTMRMLAGYWPSPSIYNVSHLVQCPFPKACNPDGNCTCRLQTLTNLTHASSSRSISSLITECNASCICHKGNTDRFCSRCQKGFYKTGGLCYPCPETKDNPSLYIFIPVFAISVLLMLWSFLSYKAAPKTAFIVVAVEFLLMVVFTLLEMMPAWVFKLDLIIFVLCMTNRGKNAHSLINIGVFYIQTLDSMVSTVDVWPPQVFKIQHYVSSFWNLHFSSLSCEFSILFSPVGKFAFVLLLPFFCMVLIGWYLVISTVYNKLRHQEKRLRNIRFKCRQLTMSCLNFTYFPIVEATVSVLRPCDDDRGIRFMPQIPWIECTSQTYRVLFIMGWVSVLFYVIGFPLILFILMVVFFRKRPTMSTEERHDMDSWLGGVYLPYKPKYQLYFELILVLRRLLLAFALSFLASLGSVQTIVVWLILIISALIQFRFQPYQTSKNHCPFENAFEFVILFVLSMSFMVLRFAALGSSFSPIFVWFVMIVNGGVLVGLVMCILYLLGLRIPFRCGRRRFEVNDSSLSHVLVNPTEDDQHLQWE